MWPFKILKERVSHLTLFSSTKISHEPIFTHPICDEDVSRFIYRDILEMDLVSVIWTLLINFQMTQSIYTWRECLDARLDKGKFYLLLNLAGLIKRGFKQWPFILMIGERKSWEVWEGQFCLCYEIYANAKQWYQKWAILNSDLN